MEKRAKGPSHWSVNHVFSDVEKRANRSVASVSVYTTVLVMWRKGQKGISLWSVHYGFSDVEKREKRSVALVCTLRI